MNLKYVKTLDAIKFSPIADSVAGLLQRDTKNSAPDSKSKSHSETVLENESGYCCANCLTLITRIDNAFNKLGQHQHLFVNPQGYEFLIGCFSEAGGCWNTGDWVSEHSWFPGYLWRYSLCAACQSHLGWQFRCDNDSFFGLISARLVNTEKLH